MDCVRIQNISHRLSQPLKVGYCDSFYWKLKGLMFQKHLEPYEGLILVEKQNSRINASIHMLFMNFDISVIWLDNFLTVVEKKIAQKGQIALCPKMPASYTLEIHPDRFPDFQIGDKLGFETL